MRDMGDCVGVDDWRYGVIWIVGWDVVRIVCDVDNSEERIMGLERVGCMWDRDIDGVRMVVVINVGEVVGVVIEVGGDVVERVGRYE